LNADHGVRPVVFGRDEGRQIDLGNFAMSLKADTNATGGLFSLLESSEPANFGPPLHIHQDCAEAFYVLDGVYTMFIGEDTTECGPGAFVFIPRGTRHGFRTGATTARKLNLYAPAAMVGYFDDLSAAILSGAASDDRLNEIAEAHGMVVVGPVPEGYL
jgi:mannose-6-phosphate isomerase-like protein (cupin superfamily)